MTLPTTSAAIAAGTPADHAAWHNELDGLFPWLNLPTVSTATLSGHLAHHESLHGGAVGGTLRTDINENDSGHLADHLAVHLAATGYGADATLGEALEPATTTGTQATTGTVASVLSAANPGDTILLRAGSYGSITVPAGTSGNPITVKAYGDEVATITAQSTLNSYTRLAKVRVESDTAQWLFRIGSTTATAVQDVEIRNCTLRGGTTEAIRIRQNAQNIRIVNCDIEGGQTGHVVKVHYESVTGFQPQATIINCRLRKRLIANGGIFNYATTEDLLQFEGHGTVVANRITFGVMQATTSAEDGLDVKTPGTGGSATISHSLFEGPFGAEAGILQAVSDDTTLRYSKIQGDSLSIGASSQNVSALVDHCWFVSSATLRIRRSGESPRQPARVYDCTLDGGTFQLGTTTGGDQPTNADLQRNTLNGTNIVINAGSTYTCTNSVLNGTTGATLTCT